MSANLENDQKNRIWQLFLHAEDTFYNRLNFFVIFETLLLGVVSLLFSRPTPAKPLLIGISILGLCSTAAWTFSQARQLDVYHRRREYVSEVIPEYQAVRDRQKKWFLSSMLVLTFIPGLLVILWIVFLIFFIFFL